MGNISIVSDKHIENNIHGHTLSTYYMCDNTLYSYDYGSACYVFVDKYVGFLMKKIDISTINMNMKDEIHHYHDLIVDKDTMCFYYKTDSLYDEFLDTLLKGGDCLLFSHIFINYSHIDHRFIPLPYMVEKMMNKSNGYQSLYVFRYEEEYPLTSDIRDLIMFEKNFI